MGAGSAARVRRFFRGRKEREMALSIIGFAGSTSRPSKTRLLVEQTANRVAAVLAGGATVFDLVDNGRDFGAAFSRAELSGTALERLSAIENADALIVGSPVYKGSYTGLFKHVFDLVEPERLLGKPVLLIATGGGHRHALVVEHQLRPLFGFFGALTVPTSIYAAPVDFGENGAVKAELAQRLSTAAAELSSFVNKSNRVAA
jgi:FMN reductase